MPSKNCTDGPNTSKPWRARVRRRGIEIWLGNFATWEEAYEAEQEFRKKKGLRHYPAKANSLTT
jgi:hypothetical protein